MNKVYEIKKEPDSLPLYWDYDGIKVHIKTAVKNMAWGTMWEISHFYLRL